VFACGDIFHEFLQNILVKNTNGLPEQSYRDDEVSVRVDFVDDDSIYEFKSMHSRAFWYMQKELEEGKTIFEIKPDHVLQAVLGARCFKKNTAHLIYISKDDLCIKQFTINALVYENILSEELESIKYFINSGLLPPPEPRLYKDNKECEFCQWKDRCVREEEMLQEKYDILRQDL
jgi:hypothetical protein